MPTSYYKITCKDFFKYFNQILSEGFYCKGRASQREYFVYFLCSVMYELLFVACIGLLLLGFETLVRVLGVMAVIVSPVFVPVFSYLHWAGFSCCIRRLHDQGRSGWRYVAYLYPSIIIMTIIPAIFQSFLAYALASVARYSLQYYFFLRQPSEGVNKFGNSPVHE
jgi:uncharacterized membrane protein YhaH (DUF805 family)